VPYDFFYGGMNFFYGGKKNITKILTKGVSSGGNELGLTAWPKSAWPK